MKSLYPLVSRVQNVSNVKLSESLATNPTENLLKKFILRSAGVVALFLFLGGSVWGQVSYTATRTTGITFNSISATGTSFTGWRNGTTNTDDNLSGSTNIGFNFTYDGVTRSTFSVSTNGFLTFNTGTTALGSGTVAYGYQNTRFSNSTGSFLTLAPLYDDQVCVGNPNTAAGLASSIKYQLTGSAPNRILTVEWIGMEVFSNAGPNLNYQVKLYETTNNIEFVYGTMSASTASYTYSLGLNGTTISATPTSTQLYTQQTNNTATFSATPQNSLTAIPASSSRIIFTPVTPTISTVASLTSFSTCVGTASAAQSFSVSGANMVAGITITPPVGFEVSTSSTFASNIGTSATPITVGAAGTIASTPVYVRLASTATGTPSGNIALTSTGATTQNIAVTGAVNTTSNPSGTISNDAAACGNVTLSYSSPDASIYWQTSASGTSTSSPTTSSYSLASSGTIYARAYNSTIGCWSTGTVNSGAITVVPTAPATVSITASASGTICAGTGVTFTPTASTPSNTNSYVWYLNNVQVGTSSTYSTTSLANGDQVYCVLTTSSPCATVPTATSNTITMSVASFPTTQATINAYTNNTSGTGLTVNWTRGNGSTGVIVVARAIATAAVDPSSGTTYTANATFGSGTGTAITGTGNFVVYVGTGTNVAVTGLAGNTAYTFTVYEYSSSCYLTPGSSSAVTTPIQNALSFDGTNDKVNCGTSASIDITGTAITLEAWIYPTAWRTELWRGNIINKELGNFGGYMLRCGASGTLNFNFGNGTGWVELSSSSGALTLNTWQHVAGTYDGTTLRLYKDGVLLNSSASTASIATATSAQQLTIGNWSQGTDRGFQGIIDEVRIWSVARSAADLTAGMTQSPDVCSSGLRASYNFNQGVAGGTNSSVTNLTDATPNANNGTLANLALTGASSNWVVGKSGIADPAATGCSGTPTPGNTTASSTSVTSGTVVTLGLQNTTCGSGVTYQWQSSTTSSTAGFSDVSGATNANYAPTVTAGAWYRCNVTCSGNTGTSAVIQVNVIYCTPSYTNTVYFINGFSTSGGITNITNTSGTTPLTSSYSNYTAQSCSQIPTSSINYSIPLSSSAASGGTGVAIYVDWNNNLVFETSERMTPTLTAYVYATYTGSFAVPANTAQGNYRMRVVLDYNAFTPAACALSSINGEFEDYTFSVVVPSISTNGTLSAYSACSGSVSTTQSFTVSGANLGANLVVTAPTGFEVSTTQNGTYTSSVSFTPSSGTVSSQTVWARLSATAAGTPSGNIAVSSTGGTTQNITISGTVNSTPTAVTVTGGAICSGGTITATGGTGGTIYWQGTSSNGTSTSIGSGTTSPAISSAGTYYARSQSTEGCWGTQGSASVTITPIPTCIGAGFAPVDASSSVNPVVGATITWSAVSDATSYDVYFGTDNTPSNIANGLNQIGLSYETGELIEGTTYYWSIVPKNSCGAASNCSVYSFTTTSACTAPTISSTSNVSINCFNQSTGSITVNATGGVTGYEYSKDNGTTWQSSNVFGSLSVGSYTIVVKGGDGCVGAPSIVTLTQPAAALSVSTSGSGSGCGGSTLSLSSNVTGGTSPYTYSWSNAGGLDDATVASPTATIGEIASHTLTVTDANGCTASSSAVTITNNSPAAPTVVTPDAICQGESVDLTANSASSNPVQWYDSSVGGNIIANSNFLTVSPNTTSTYYASAFQAATPTVQTITANQTFTVPAGVNQIKVEAWGAGGAGGGARFGGASCFYCYASGGGGGGGAYNTQTINVTPGQQYSLTIGAGGIATTQDGPDGGNTTFSGSFGALTANGGKGGKRGIDGTDGAGGLGGSGTFNGGNGAQAYTLGTYNNAGGGGGGAGNAANGSNAVSASDAQGGPAGSGGTGSPNLSPYTGGNGGSFPTLTYQLNGLPGAIPGGGGSGASGNNANTTGGNGGNGRIVLTYTVFSGCSSALTPVTVTVNEAPTAITGAALSAICQGQTSAAMGGSIGGTATSGSWSGGAGTWSNANDPENATYTAGAFESGTVTLTLTPSGGSCPGIPSSKTLTVNSNPLSLSITPSSANICSGSSQALSIGSAINASYQFSNSTTTYTPLSGTSVSTSTASGDDASQSAISLGFNFTYGGVVYNQFGVSTNGVIQLGSTTTSSLTNALATTANIIAPMWDDNHTSAGSVKYMISGQSPNQVLTVEWFNVAIGGGGATANSTNNFQVKLYQTSNVIQFVYGSGMSSSNAITASIGISNSVGAYLSVSPGAPATVSSITENSGISSVASLTSGTTYTFTPISVAWSPTTSLYTDLAATTAYSGTSAATVYAKPSTTTTYTATATSAAGCASSNTVQVAVSPTSVGGTASSDQTICSGVTPTALSLAGNTGTIQWQSSTTSSTTGFTNVSGATSATLTLGALTTTTYYRAVVTSGVCTSANSNVVTITVNAIPSAPVVTVVDNCNGTSTLSTTATGTLLWSTTETTSPITVSTAGTYTVTQTANGCTSASGSGVAAPKTTPETPSVIVTNDCGLSTLSFTPAENATILWSNNATMSSTTTANSETLTVVQTVNGCASLEGSGSAVPLVIPSAPIATAAQNFCVTDNATVASLAYTNVAGNTYTWYDAATAGNTVATSTPLPTATTNYYLSATGSNGCTSTARTLVAATESAQALATVSITGTSTCPGGEIAFTATPSNGGNSPTYQWYNGGVPISGATSETYSATGLAEGAVITVKMIPSGSCVTVCPN